MISTHSQTLNGWGAWLAGMEPGRVIRSLGAKIVSGVLSSTPIFDSYD